MLGKVDCQLHLLLSLHIFLFIMLSLGILPTMLDGFDYKYFSDSNTIRISKYAECPEQMEKICVGDQAYFGENGELVLDSNEVESRITMGIALYSKPIQLWNKHLNKTADFTTEFSFIISSTEYYPMGMLAFIMTSLPSEAGFLTSNNFLVSILKKSNELGLKGFEVGINIFSDKSELNYSNYKALPIVDEMNPKGDVRIHYDSLNYNLQVFVDNKDLASTIIFSHVVDLKTVLPENVSIGFIGVSNYTADLHKITSWSFPQSKSASTGFAVGDLAIAMLLIIFSLFLAYGC